MRWLALFALLAPLAALAFQNEPSGFRGIEWEAPAAQVKGLQEVSRRGDLVSYHRPDDKMQIGGAEIESIFYTFYKGKFSSVIIKTTGVTNRSELKQAVFSQFGKGYQSNRYIESWIWSGQQTRMMLKCNSIDTVCRLLIASTVSWKERDTDEKARGEAAGKDF